MKIYIKGIGLVTSLGFTVYDVWGKLASKQLELQAQPYKIPGIVNNSVIRKMNRYSYLALYATKTAADNARFSLEMFRPEEVGTVFNTGFGPMTTIGKFAESVYNNDPYLASPTVFANTVFNSCLGHVCEFMGLKGCSTLFIGSNNIGYSLELLLSGKAKAIFTGGVDEYFEPLFDSFKKLGTVSENEADRSKKAYLSEGAAVLYLEAADSQSRSRGETPYCELVDYSEANIGFYPLVEPEKTVDQRVFKAVILQTLEKSGIKPDCVDLVITSQNGWKPYDAAEDLAISEVFDKGVNTIAPKKIFGDTMGCSLSLNTAVGALCLKYQINPFNDELKKLNYVLVNSSDISGGLFSVLLKKHEGD